MLERSLPELAETVKRRQTDPFLLDPSNVLRFELVDNLRELVTQDPMAATVFERLRYPEQPMLAALVLGGHATVATPGAGPPARRPAPARRARRGAAGRARVRREPHPAASTRLDGLDEEPVLVLATHLETPERVRARSTSSPSPPDRWSRGARPARRPARPPARRC